MHASLHLVNKKNSSQVSPQLLQFKQLHQHFVNKFALKKQKSILKNGSLQTRLDRPLSLIIKTRRKTSQKVWSSFSINFVMIHIESSLMTANTVKLQQTSHQFHLRNTLQAWSPPVSWALNSAEYSLLAGKLMRLMKLVKILRRISTKQLGVENLQMAHVH